jgi:hypothetical protein
VAGVLDQYGTEGDNGPATSAQLWSPIEGVGHPTDSNVFWIIDTG